jgi:hypothetical protein
MIFYLEIAFRFQESVESDSMQSGFLAQASRSEQI